MLQRDVIGQLIWNQNYYWLNIKMKIVEMVFVRLVDVPDCWRNRGDPNKVNEQSKRLTTQVVFTAAIYEIFLTCSVLSWSYCTVRASVRSVFGVVCPRKLLKERAVEQGVIRPLCSLGSLFLIFHKSKRKADTDTWLRLWMWKTKGEQFRRSARTKGCTGPFNWAVIKLIHF